MKIWTIPNVITLFRLVLVFMLPFYAGDPKTALFIAALVILGDVEGYLARWLNQVSDVGAILDKTADVCFLSVGFYFFVIDTPQALIAVLLIALSRIIKSLLLKKFTTTNFFAKTVYVIAYMLVLLGILQIQYPLLLYLLTILFWAETVWSIHYI